MGGAACRILGKDCCCYDGAGVSTGWIVTVATSRGGSIFKYRFRNTVAADEEICLVVKKGWRSGRSRTCRTRTVCDLGPTGVPV